MKTSKYKFIELPKITDGRGNLTFIEAEKHVPFKIKRTYFIYAVPHNQVRGNHAHKTLYQFIIAINGSFNITLDDGMSKKKKYHLTKPNSGLYLAPMVWRKLDDFSENAVCLCLVSELYDENDYIRDYKYFKKMVKKNV